MNLSPSELETWLEWAGQRLIAMPGARVGPKDASAAKWPDFSQDIWEVVDFRVRIALRVVAPNGYEIGLMEAILDLPNLIGTNDDERSQTIRKIVRRRTLLHPITGRHLFTWTAMAKRYGVSPFIVRSRYEAGLLQVCRRIERPRAQTIGEQFQLLVLAA